MKELDDDILYIMRFFTAIVVGVLAIAVIIILGVVTYNYVLYDLPLVFALSGCGMLVSTISSGSICLVDLGAFKSLTNGFIKLCVVIDSLSNKGKK